MKKLLFMICLSILTMGFANAMTIEPSVVSVTALGGHSGTHRGGGHTKGAKTPAKMPKKVIWDEFNA